MVVNLLYRLVIVYVKDSILIHSGVETSGNQLGIQVHKSYKIFPEIKNYKESRFLNILMLTLADGLLLGSIGIVVSVIALYVILNCMSDSDSAEGLKDEELNVVERFWRDLDK